MTATILLVSSQPSQWQDFTAGLSRSLSLDIAKARTGAEALHIAREKAPLAAIIDTVLADMDGVALVRCLLEVNAMIHIGLVSDLPARVFHDKTEGLGIMLQLPPNPDAHQADILAERLRTLTQIA